MWKENKAKIRHILAWVVLLTFTALSGYIGVEKMIVGAIFTLLSALDAHTVTWFLGGTVLFQCICGLLVAGCIWLVGFVLFPFIWGEK